MKEQHNFIYFYPGANYCLKFELHFRGQNGEQEDEPTIPRAAMNKMIKEILPNIRVANEVSDSTVF